MTDSHIFPRAEVTEYCEDRLPRDKSVLKNAEKKPDFVNCHSSICCQNRRANKASLWVPDKYLLPWLRHNAVCLCRHTRAVTKDVEVREWSQPGLSGVSHILNTQHLKPGCSGLLLWVEETLRGLDTSFLPQCSRGLFSSCASNFLLIF